MNSLIVKSNQDIYFDDNYGKIYEKVENGIAEIFQFKSEFGEVKNQFLIREIPIRIGEDTYYDIVTPYGYGGPIIVEHDNKNKNLLLSQYHNDFKQYCKANNIVSEFIRFHPIINNDQEFERFYNISYDRSTLGTNLKQYDDPVQSEFSKSCRKNIRKALNKGITFNVLEKPKQIDDFKKIYYSTMDRNNAADYYYFDEEYFDNILSLFSDNIILVSAIYEEKIIAQGLYFIYGKMIHIHLSGTLSEYLYLSPAYILRYAITLWGKENGYEMIHHGGGRTKSKDDGLYKFKKGFAQNTEFNFMIGKKIWNEDIYLELCRIKGVKEASAYFPLYRIDT